MNSNIPNRFSRQFAFWMALGILLASVLESAAYVVIAAADGLMTYAPPNLLREVRTLWRGFDLAFSGAFLLVMWVMARQGLGLPSRWALYENRRRWIWVLCLLLLGLLGSTFHLLSALQSLHRVGEFPYSNRWNPTVIAFLSSHPGLLLGLNSLGYSILAVLWLPKPCKPVSADPEADTGLSMADYLARRRHLLMTEHGLSEREAQELEEHLLDQMAQIQAEGIADSHARAEASRRLGSLTEIAAEYRRGDPARIWRPRILAVAGGAIIQHVAVYILGPLYNILIRNAGSTWGWPSLMNYPDWLDLLLTILACAGLLSFVGSQSGGKLLCNSWQRLQWLVWLPLMAELAIAAYFRINNASAGSIPFLQLAVIFVKPIAFAAFATFLARRSRHSPMLLA